MKYFTHKDEAANPSEGSLHLTFLSGDNRRTRCNLSIPTTWTAIEGPWPPPNDQLCERCKGTLARDEVPDPDEQLPSIPLPATTEPYVSQLASQAIGPGNVIVGRDTIVVGHRSVSVSGDSVRGSTIAGQHESLTADQAVERIGAATRLASEQLQKNIEQARRESSQFFRLTLVSTGVGFVFILGGIVLALVGQTPVAVLTGAAGLITEATAVLFFNKDKELRQTIESYHKQMLETQQILTMVEVANTIEVQTERDHMKQRIIYRALNIQPSASGTPKTADAQPRD